MAIIGEGRFTYEASGDNWGDLPEGWFYREAGGVAVDSKDQVYVFNRGTCPMIVFNRDGSIARTWGDGVFKTPHGVSVGPDDEIYCVDSGDSTIRKFTPEGKLLMTLGTADSPAPKMGGKPFNRPTHLAVDKRTGELLIADGYSNARVHKYTADGEYLSSWGESGTGEGQFNIVHNIDTDRDGRVYIADRENRRVQVFNSEGEFLAQWGNLSRTAAVYVDTRGDRDLVYAGEYFGGIGSNDTGTDLGPRVTVFDTSGKILARVSREPYGDEPGRFYAPHGMAVDSHGDVYVGEVSWTEFGKNFDPPREVRSVQKLVLQR